MEFPNFSKFTNIHVFVFGTEVTCTRAEIVNIQLGRGQVDYMYIHMHEQTKHSTCSIIINMEKQ